MGFRTTPIYTYVYIYRSWYIYTLIMILHYSGYTPLIPLLYPHIKGFIGYLEDHPTNRNWWVPILCALKWLCTIQMYVYIYIIILYLSIYIYIYIYMHIFFLYTNMYVHVCIYIYIYIHMWDNPWSFHANGDWPGLSTFWISGMILGRSSWDSHSSVKVMPIHTQCESPKSGNKNRFTF